MGFIRWGRLENRVRSSFVGRIFNPSGPDGRIKNPSYETRPPERTLDLFALQPGHLETVLVAAAREADHHHVFLRPPGRPCPSVAACSPAPAPRPPASTPTSSTAASATNG